MEFLDEETRPRFLFQSRSSQPSNHPDESQPSDRLLKPSLFLSLSLSTLLFSLSIFSTQPEPFKSLLLWISFSLLLGPFAPSSLTAGDIRVGAGKLLADPLPPSSELEKPNRRSKNRRFEENPVPESAQLPNKSSNSANPTQTGQNPVFESAQLPKKASNSANSRKTEQNPVLESAQLPKKVLNLVNSTKSEEREWSEGDLEMLKKLLTKHPVGKPRRWEAISEAFGGAHTVESVIRTVKSLGEKKMDDSDSFARFLKDRKPLDRRVEEEIGAVGSVEEGWSGSDDVALLNGLKAFPKETSLRWEKIAAAVPGKTKAACVKRVAELKKGFRSAKGSNES